jgi:hypothetical protein
VLDVVGGQLDHHRVAHPVRRGNGGVGVGHDLLRHHRHTVLSQKGRGVVLGPGGAAGDAA